MQASTHVTAAAVALLLFGCGADDSLPSEAAGTPAGSSGAAGSAGSATTGAAPAGSGGGDVSATGGTAGGGASDGAAGGSSGAAGDGGAGAGGAGAGAGGTGAGAGGAGAGGAATCDPADETADPTPVNVRGMGAAFTGSHEVVVEKDPGLSGRTIFRPKDLGGANKYPIVAWGQGGCSLNGTTNPDFLGELASHGYLVISDGEPNGSGSRQMVDDYKAMGKPLIESLDWAIKENGRACSQYYRNLAADKVAVMGWSCGGLMAEGAAGDPRVTTAVIWSSGMINPDQKILDALHAPIAFILGGPDDVAYPNGTRDYRNTSRVPAVLASTNVGHGGTYGQDNGGVFGKVGVAWLGWQLKGDMGATGKGMFVGASCGLCTDRAWTIESKNVN
ncbi:alpha/beta hydrolase family protein [Sorangium sp. So ce693]|uniref:alpha/beta hydrolase family protein n=1 Tax=Sorangium sp. So ce693 TaxID=3133318 RepID=UPI003F5E8E6D